MAYALSPGITVTEKDFTSIVPSVAASTGAFAGVFQWGPTIYPTQITNENDLVALFGKPSANTFESFFTAANFLSYTNSLYVTRQDSTGLNAVGSLDSSQIAAGTAQNIGNIDVYNTSFLGGANTSHWAAKYKGTFGNSLKVSFADSATFKNLALTGTVYAITLGGTALTATGSKFLTELHIGAIIKDTTGAVVGTVTAIASDTAATVDKALIALSNATGVKADWAYYQQFDSAPGTSTYATSSNATNDELHVIVIDEDGTFTGSAGTVLEKFAYVSKALDARKYDGSNNYFRDVINSSSKYIYWLKNTTNVVSGSSNWGSVAAGVTFKSLIGAMTTSLAGGTDDYSTTPDTYATAAWALYSEERYDVRLLPLGKATAAVASSVVSLAENRLDCIAFISPQNISTGNVITGNGSAATDALFAYKSAVTPVSSYSFFDSGYKYQYDRYNDVYRWVPLNGDIAGLAARTDYTNDAWWSFAGLNRGQIKNVVKLAVNPTKTDRNTLYQSSINSVVSFPNQGVILFGDRTGTTKPSAFREVGIRRLFILLEKSIGKASEYQLFEFNDSFTRAQFKNLVEPFLRDVKGRRGVTDFKVVCDDTNNSADVQNRQEFVGDIYIKPNHSINFITLNFIATKAGVDFSVVGA